MEKIVTIHGESRLVTYLKMGNIVKEFFKRALKLFINVRVVDNYPLKDLAYP